MAEDPKEIELILRSLLVSTSSVLTANTLEREFRNTEERPFPSRKLGFSSFVDYLRSIPSVVTLKPNYSDNPEVHPVVSEASKHVNELVVNTKKSKPRSARSSGFSRRKEPIRRRSTPFTCTSTPRSYQPASVSNTYSSRPAPVSNTYTSRPAPVSNTYTSRPAPVSNYSTSRQSQAAPVSNSSTSRQSQAAPVSNSSTSRLPQSAPVSNVPTSRPSQPPASNGLSSTNSEEFRKLLSELIYEVEYCKNGIRIADLEYNMNRYQLRNSRIRFSELLNQAVADNKIYREENYVYPELSTHTTNHATYQNNNNNNKPESINDEGMPDEDYYGDTEDAYPHWENMEDMSEEDMSNMTIEYFLKKSKTQSHQSEWNYKENTKPESTKSEENDYASSINGYDGEPNVSDKMIANFRIILDNNPDGFRLSELAGKYLDTFKVPLDYGELRYESAILMAYDLPEVFYVQRDGLFGDWNVFDARKFRDQAKPSIEHQNSDHASNGPIPIVQVIPKSILEDIKSLAEHYSDGFKSTELRPLYEKHFRKSLDWQKMGYERLGDFVNALSNIVTVQRVTDYFFILPKHFIKTYSTAHPKPIEVLTLEKDSFLRSTPENVLKTPLDTIPHQELPPFYPQEHWTDPLLEPEIRITEIINPQNFFFVLSTEYNNLQIMMDDLDKFYKQVERDFRIPPVLIVSGLYVACLFDGYWHRAKTLSCSNNLVEIEYIDYGTVAKVDTSELRFLLNGFASLPVQAFRGELLNVHPPDGGKNWPRESSIMFLKLVNNKRLFSQIFDFDNDSNHHLVYRMIIYDTEIPQKEIIINEFLVEEGFAMGEEQFAKLEENQDCFLPDKSSKAEGFADSSLRQDCSLNPTASVNLELPELQETAKPTRSLNPPPGFEIKETVEPIPPQISSSSNSTSSNYPSFSKPTQSGIWGPYENKSPQFVNNYQNIPTVPPNMPSRYSYTTQSNLRTPTAPIQANTFYQARETTPASFFNQNQAQLNVYLNSNNLPFTYANYGPNLSNNIYIQPGNIIRPPFQNFLPNYTVPTNYQPPLVSPEAAYLQLLLQANLHNPLLQSANLTTPVFPHAPVRSEMTTSQLLNIMQNSLATRPATNATKPVQPSTSSPSCNSVPSQPLPEASTTANVKRVTPTTTQSLLYQAVKELENVTQLCQTTKTRDSKPDTSCSKDTQIKVEPPPIVDKAKDVETSNPEPASSPTSCEVKSIFKKSQRTKLAKPSSLARVSSEEAIRERTRRLSLKEELDSPEPHGELSRMSSLSLLTSTSDEDYASCNENTAQSPANSQPGVPDSWEGLVQDSSPCDTTTEPIDEPKTDSNVESHQRNTNENQTKTSDTSGNLVYNEVFKEVEFHILRVNDSLAVLADEFYPLFTNRSSLFYTKMMEANGKELHMISKATDPALFSLIEKMEFHSTVDRKTVIRLGKSKISYLSEIPEIFSILHYENKHLIKKLKDIEKKRQM